MKRFTLSLSKTVGYIHDNAVKRLRTRATNAYRAQEFIKKTSFNARAHVYFELRLAQPAYSFNAKAKVIQET